MAVRVVRLGTPRLRGEGLRLGTVRRLPRGVRKADYAKRDFFDLWLPELAPGEKLVKSAFGKDLTSQEWRRFAAAYRREMAQPTPQRLLAVLAALSRQADFSVGCYCEDESRCHRSLLRGLLVEQGARTA
jgi:uncharacterized protein YeaO (DUF488 family)